MSEVAGPCCLAHAVRFVGDSSAVGLVMDSCCRCLGASFGQRWCDPDRPGVSGHGCCFFGCCFDVGLRLISGFVAFSWRWDP